jgi:phosphate:Na+ symporter
LETLVSIVGGVGLFLLGMAVMTDGLKALAGTALKTVMEKAAATPLLGTFWGAVITLIVQSSSATTMTTIGLVSAGLLTFPQGLSLVFGANIGTTGTGWLVAAFGVRISLTAAALPIVFVGALLKVVGRGRLAAAGSAIAGFALILVGLSTLQQGMGGLAESLHPSDLPTVTNAAGAINLAGMVNVLLLVVVGAIMTTVMQSSTAAIAVTLSALYAGAVGLDQALALVIGQNIGTATSSAVAAIGASSTAKRLAVAYIAFKLVAALIAIVLFPFVTPLIVRASQTIDSTGLLAAYHTAYNVIGVAVLLPLMGPFTRAIERFVPERGTARPVLDDATRVQASDGVRAASDFLSKSDPPPSDEGHAWFTSTVHALDHANRLADAVDAMAKTGVATDGPDELNAAALCAQSMRGAAGAAANLAVHAGPAHAADDELAQKIVTAKTAVATRPESRDNGTQDLERSAKALADLRATHRSATLDMVASGKVTASQAIARVDAVALMSRLAHHAWRAVAHLERAAAARMELEQ